MKTMNGFTIIAHAPAQSDPLNGVVLLGARYRGGTEMPYEYVTARSNNLNDTEWFTGRYFSTIIAAVTDYNERVNRNV